MFLYLVRWRTEPCYKLTSILGDIAVQTTEDNIDLILELLCAAVLEHKIAQLFAHGQALLPLDGILVLLAGVPRAGSHSGEGEVRVEGEEEDEALAYAAGCTKYTCEMGWSAIDLCCLLDRLTLLHCYICHALPRVRWEWTH